MIRPAFKAIASLLPTALAFALACALAFTLAPGLAHAQSETATYTMTFEGLWTVDDITDIVMPGGAHFTEVIGATHNSDTTIWASGGMASDGVEDVAELGVVIALVSEIGQNTYADVVVRAGSSFISPTQTVTGTFTATSSHPLVSVLSMVAPSPDWFVGVSNLNLYNNGWRNRVVELYPYDAGTEQGSGWSLGNAATFPQGVIESIRSSGRFLDNPIARISFTSEQATDEDEDSTEEPSMDAETHSADYTVPLLVPPGASGGPQGKLRILNGTAESGTVEIYAVDDAGNRTGPATFTLNASAAAEFTATDLQSGNASLGLTGGIGTEMGDVRLLIDTHLEIVPLALVRAADGTLSAMHDTVRAASTDGSGQYAYEVPVFNPSTEMIQVSRLRLINTGDAEAAVTIGGRDDSGASATGGDVTLMLAAGGAKTLTSQQLEAGDSSVTGQLGAGAGKWRLTVSSDQPLQVVNIVASTSGYWNNLSTTAVARAAPADQASFNERFVGESVIYETNTGRFTLNAMEGEQFSETGEADGVMTTAMGSYSYEAIGPNAGRLTLTYDDDGDDGVGVGCRANFYFSSRTNGWFASRCTGSDDPDGYWLGGNWSIVDPDDPEGPEDTADADDMTSVSRGDCYAGLVVGIGENCTYPGTTDEFSVNVRGRGSFLGRLAGIRIQIENETIDGRVYDFEASHQGDGVWRIDRVAGST